MYFGYIDDYAVRVSKLLLRMYKNQSVSSRGQGDIHQWWFWE